MARVRSASGSSFTLYLPRTFPIGFIERGSKCFIHPSTRTFVVAMADVHSDDYYKVLGVGRSASEQEISKAYKKLAIKWHPDKNAQNREKAEENFKKVSEAYEVLSNKEKRQIYDQFGKQGLEGGMGGMGGMGGGFPGGGEGQRMNFAQAQNIFEAFFGGQDPFSMFGDDGMGGGMPRGGMPGGGPRMSFNMGGMPGGGMGGGFPSGMAEMLFSQMGGMPGGMPGGMGAGGGFGPNGMPTGPGRSPASAPYPDRPDVIPKGARVRLRNLTAAAHQNGKDGTIQNYDASRARYQVAINGDGETLSIKGANLLQLVGVTIRGVSSSPEYNNTKGSVVGFDGDGVQGRYHITTTTGKAVALKPANVIIEDGCRIWVGGLSKQELNGKQGKIVNFDQSTGRYTVQLANTQNQLVKLKPENVVL